MYSHTQKQGNVKRELDILLSKTLSMFRYEGLPDSIPQRELERQLQMKGYAFITKYKGKLYSFTDGLGGEPDPYGNPTKITIANPALKYNATLDLEKDGVLIRSDSMQNGLRYLLEKYVTMMNESDVTMMVNSFNARMPALISAGDDKTRESAEQYLQRIINGEMGIIAENRLFEGVNVQNTGINGSSFTSLIEYQQYLKATLYNELGLEMNNNMKRERLTQDEVNMTDIVYPFVDNMITNRQMGVEKVNKMFGTEITVGFDSIWAKHAPSDAWDNDQFYEELDEYLDLFLKQEEPEAPVEEVEEDILPDVSEEELVEILEKLKALSEEGENGSRESSTIDGDSADSVTHDGGALRDVPESGGDTESVEGHHGYDNEPAGHYNEESDGPSGEYEGSDVGETDEPDDSDDEPDDSTDGEPDDGRGSVGTPKADQTVIELTVSTGRTDNEDSGAHSEAEIHDATTAHTGDEILESGDAGGSGSTSVDITDEDGGSGDILLEGAEVDEIKVDAQEGEVEIQVDEDGLQATEDGLQTVSVALEVQPTGTDEETSIDISIDTTEEGEEDEDES